MWNVSIETHSMMTDQAASEATEALAEWQSAIYQGALGGLAMTIRLDAEKVRQAAVTALALVEGAGMRVRTLEVMTTQDYNAGARNWDDLVSVAEAAAELGISQQTILSRIQSGSLLGRQVGSTWVIPRAGLLSKRHRRSRHRP